MRASWEGEKMNKFKYIFLLFIISGGIQFYIQDFILKPVVINIFFQFVTSWLLGYGFTQFYNKYYASSYITWWTRFYIIIILFTILDFLLF